MSRASSTFPLVSPPDLDFPITLKSGQGCHSLKQPTGNTLQYTAYWCLQIYTARPPSTNSHLLEPLACELPVWQFFPIMHIELNNQKQLNTLVKVLEESNFKFLCPNCLRGFSTSTLLYRHFRQKRDFIHQGLDLSRRDFDLFLYCYQACMGPSITATNIPSAPRCFDLPYIIQHLGEETESLDSQNSDYGMQYIYISSVDELYTETAFS